MATISGAFLDEDLDAIYGTPGDEAVYDGGIFDVLGRYDENPATADFDSPEAIAAGTGTVALSKKAGFAEYTYTNGDDTIVLVNKTTAKLYTLGDDFDDAVLTKTAGAVALTGNALDNFLGGNDLANTINGGAGNDSILAGAGIDTINYNLTTDGDDLIIGGTSQDIVNLSGISSGGNGIRLTFTSAEVGNDASLDSGALANQDGGLAVRIDQEFGDDAIVLGSGGRSDDEGVTFVAVGGIKLDVRDLPTGIARGSFDQVALGTSGNDSLTFAAIVTAATDDYINAGAGNDTISSGAGNDFLVGGIGNDNLKGGIGNDTYIAGIGNDVITDSVGDDVVIGSVGDGNDIISVGITKVVSGQSDNDNVNAGDGNNTISTGLGNDTITSLGGDDRITTLAGNKLVNAGDGNNTVTTGAGNDNITTGDGRDIIISGTGNDTIFAGGNHDSVTAGDGDDSVFGGAGRDTILGGNGNDTILGEADNDSIDGGAGNDQLYGGDGNDTIIGGVGNDTIVGGAGNDFLTGGDGADMFMISTSDLGVDVITAFEAKTVSGVTTSDTLFINARGTPFGFDDFEVSAFPDPSYKAVTISLDGGGSIILKGVDIGDLFFNNSTDTFSIVKDNGSFDDES